MSGLTQRSLAEEQMDAADLPEDTYAAVLADPGEGDLALLQQLHHMRP